MYRQDPEIVDGYLLRHESFRIVASDAEAAEPDLDGDFRAAYGTEIRLIGPVADNPSGTPRKMPMGGGQKRSRKTRGGTGPLGPLPPRCVSDQGCAA
jgi:hypothetical protein